MASGAIFQIRWLALCAGAGVLSGLIATFLALLISGNLYGTGLPDVVLYVPLPLFPLITFAALSAWRRRLGLKTRALGFILFAAMALAGEFMVAAVIAGADHG